LAYHSDQFPPNFDFTGGYDSRLEDNVRTLTNLVSAVIALSFTYDIVSPTAIPPCASQLIPARSEEDPQVLFLLNFTTAQRSALLHSASTLALLYTPANEHFGIVPIEAMACGLPVLACDSGGPTESIISSPTSERTGWLKEPSPEIWSEALIEIVSLSSDPTARALLSACAKRRASGTFGMDAMAKGLEDALRGAESLGKVDIGWLESLPTVFMVFIGFISAYLVGPFLFQS
jgi:alpha-1,3/alpha-1,6-mannosyltransferase